MLVNFDPGSPPTRCMLPSALFNWDVDPQRQIPSNSDPPSLMISRRCISLEKWWKRRDGRLSKARRLVSKMQHLEKHSQKLRTDVHPSSAWHEKLNHSQVSLSPDHGSLRVKQRRPPAQEDRQAGLQAPTQQCQPQPALFDPLTQGQTTPKKRKPQSTSCRERTTSSSPSSQLPRYVLACTVSL